MVYMLTLGVLLMANVTIYTIHGSYGLIYCCIFLCRHTLYLDIFGGITILRQELSRSETKLELPCWAG